MTEPKTAPRLTLETADERELWQAVFVPEFAGLCATMGGDHEPEQLTADAGAFADAAVRAYRERCAPEPSDATKIEDQVIARHFADRDERSLWLELVKLGFAPAIAWKGVQAYRDGCDPEPGAEEPCVQADAAEGGYNREPTARPIAPRSEEDLERWGAWWRLRDDWETGPATWTPARVYSAHGQLWVNRGPRAVMVGSDTLVWGGPALEMAGPHGRAASASEPGLPDPEPIADAGPTDEVRSLQGSLACIIGGFHDRTHEEFRRDALAFIKHLRAREARLEDLITAVSAARTLADDPGPKGAARLDEVDVMLAAALVAAKAD